MDLKKARNDQKELTVATLPWNFEATLLACPCTKESSPENGVGLVTRHGEALAFLGPRARADENEATTVSSLSAHPPLF